MNLQQIAPTVVLAAAGAFVIGGLAAQIRGAIRYRRWVNGPVKSQAPAEVLPECSEIVEDDEVLDAYITDAACAEMDAWYAMEFPEPHWP